MQNPSGMFWPKNRNADYCISVELSYKYRTINKTSEYEAIGMEGVIAFLTSQNAKDFLRTGCKITVYKGMFKDDAEEDDTEK